MEKLISNIRNTIQESNGRQTPLKVKEVLESYIQGENLECEKQWLTCRTECYARRLVHKDDELGFVMVAMTWGPGQGTPLHDHSGYWCVEAVMKGQILVTQYDLVKYDKNLFYFEKKLQEVAGFGDAGALIPPYEYHTIENNDPKELAVTLHVYSQEMKTCNIFKPSEAGYLKETKQLSYMNVQ